MVKVRYACGSGACRPHALAVAGRSGNLLVGAIILIAIAVVSAAAPGEPGSSR